MKKTNLTLAKLFLLVTRSPRCMAGSILVVLFVVFLAGMLFNPVMARSLPNILLLILLGLAAGILFFIDLRAERQKARLLLHGEKVTGHVANIKKSCAKLHTSTTHLGNEDAVSPYVIFYTYERDGKQYTGKSAWVWEEPRLRPGDPIEIHLDPHKPQVSAIQS